MKNWLFVLLLLASCKNESQKQKNVLSVVVFTDSVIVYSGALTNQTHIDSILLNEKNIKELIRSSLRSRGEELKILIKPAWYANAGGNTEQILAWCKEIGFTRILKASIDSAEEVVLKVSGPRFDPSGIAVPMKLNLPREGIDADRDTITAKVNAKTHTVLLLKNNQVYVYSGADITNGIFYGELYDPLFRSTLINGRKKYGKDYLVILKPSESATYKNTVDVLDEMLINDIKKYAMISIRNDEIEFTETLAQRQQ